MHDEIRKFGTLGIVGDESDIVKLKEGVVHFIEQGMRDEGYVPLLDMEPQYTQSYNFAKNSFEFQLTVYGVYVGKEEACDTAGVMFGKKIMKYIPQTKSKAS